MSGIVRNLRNFWDAKVRQRREAQAQLRSKNRSEKATSLADMQEQRPEGMCDVRDCYAQSIPGSQYCIAHNRRYSLGSKDVGGAMRRLSDREDLTSYATLATLRTGRPDGIEGSEARQARRTRSRRCTAAEFSESSSVSEVLRHPQARAYFRRHLVSAHTRPHMGHGRFPEGLNNTAGV